VIFALIEAEEYGVTQANLEQMKASTDPAIQRLLGSAEDKRQAARAGPRLGRTRPEGGGQLWRDISAQCRQRIAAQAGRAESMPCGTRAA